MMKTGHIKRTLDEIETRLQELKVARRVLKDLLATRMVKEVPLRQLKRGSYRELIVDALKNHGSLTTKGLTEKLSVIKRKKISVDSIRVALNRGRNTLFQKIGTRSWSLAPAQVNG